MIIISRHLLNCQYSLTSSDTVQSYNIWSWHSICRQKQKNEKEMSFKTSTVQLGDGGRYCVMLYRNPEVFHFKLQWANNTSKIEEILYVTMSDMLKRVNTKLCASFCPVVLDPLLHIYESQSFTKPPRFPNKLKQAEPNVPPFQNRQKAEDFLLDGAQTRVKRRVHIGLIFIRLPETRQFSVPAGSGCVRRRYFAW